MKKLIYSWLLSVLFLSVGYAQNGTERTGYDGDFFSLEGALDLFKQSNNLRDFERKLNTERNWVNNLDLNYDGRIDYIRVEHRRQGDFHAIIMQALLDRRDIQDVAVIEIEITNRREAVLQIVGDEDLYGEEVIVEPRQGYSDSRRGYSSDYGDFVNVYYWEPVQYILGRQYRVYASPYRWQYYPTYWRPWSPCTWNIFRPRIVVYHRSYHIVRRHRVIRVHNFYRNYRSYSYRVVERTNVVRVRQGRAPIYRSAPGARQDTRQSQALRRNEVVERPRTNARSTTSRQNPAVSRKKAEATSGRTANRSSIPRTEQKSRSSISRSGTSGRSSTSSQNPSTRSRASIPSVNRSSTRSSTPQARQPSRSTTTTRSRTTTTNQKSSARSRSSTPSANRSSTRSSSSQVRQPSRSTTTTRSRTTTRSSTPTRSKTSARSTTSSRKSSSSINKRSTPTSKSQSTRSSSSKRSSSSSGSRSRSGG